MKVTSINDIQNKVNTLSYDQVKSILRTYSRVNKISLSELQTIFSRGVSEKKLRDNKINRVCPYCKCSIVVRNGNKNDISHFKCKMCGKQFTMFTGTIMEKTRYPWEVWVFILQSILNNLTTSKTTAMLKYDYNYSSIDKKTVFLIKHKLLKAMSEVPMPKLTGVVQVDETHFRETQKGSRHLESMVKHETRYPRRGYRPSKLGCMGNEFVTVLCMVDATGHAVAEVTCLGRLKTTYVDEMLDKYLDHPSYICSDANNVYKNYCRKRNIPLYIRPSDYMKVIKDNGVISRDDLNRSLTPLEIENNDKIFKKLYKNKQADYIYNNEYLSYDEFKTIKKNNKLSLGKVNKFHGILKKKLVTIYQSVSSKYLNDYVGAMVYINNWQIDHNTEAATRADAEQMLLELMGLKITCTEKDLTHPKKKIKRASDSYMKVLRDNTVDMRKHTHNKYFKFDPEDNVVSFDVRNYLMNLPKYKLDELRKKYKIKASWCKNSVILTLVKQPDIHQAIYEQIMKYCPDPIDEEDAKLLRFLNWYNSAHP